MMCGGGRAEGIDKSGYVGLCVSPIATGASARAGAGAENVEV